MTQTEQVGGQQHSSVPHARTVGVGVLPHGLSPAQLRILAHMRPPCRRTTYNIKKKCSDRNNRSSLLDIRIRWGLVHVKHFRHRAAHTHSIINPSQRHYRNIAACDGAMISLRRMCMSSPGKEVLLHTKAMKGLRPSYLGH